MYFFSLMPFSSFSFYSRNYYCTILHQLVGLTCMLIAIFNFCVEFGILRLIYWITDVSRCSSPCHKPHMLQVAAFVLFFFCSFFLLIYVMTEKHKSLWNINTFWMYFPTMWQLSLSAYGDITLYQLKLKLLRHQHYSVWN